MILYFQKRFPFIIIFCCALVITPYFLATFYIHPFFDDYIFSARLISDGRLEFVKYFYSNWSGRYGELILTALFSAKVYETNLQYFLVGLFILLSLFASFYYLTKVVIAEFVKSIWVWAVAFIAFAFYLSFLPELFTSFYWNCSSYYQLCLVFLLFNIAFLIRYFKNKGDWKIKLALVVLNFFIAGFSEITVFTFGILYLSILCYQFYYNRVVDKFFVFLLLFFGVLAAVNFFAPGNFSRIDASDSHNGFLFSSVRAFYDFIIFYFVYTFFKTPFLIFLFIALPFFNKMVRSKTSLSVVLNVKPLYALVVTLLIFYLHNALSVYGAGYSLQGRTFNYGLLLFCIACLYNLLLLINYFTKKEINLFSFLASESATSFLLLLMVLLLNFSDNNRLLYGDLVRELPSFQTQLTERYSLISYAKKNKQNKVEVPPVKAMPKLYIFGNEAYDYDCFVNDKKYLKEAERHFGIEIKIKE